MVRNPARKNKLRSTLIVIIFATLPCYLLGMIVLWIGNSVIDQQNITPTITLTATLDPWGGIPTSTLPPIPTSPAIITETATITLTPSPTITYVIPSNTPTNSPTPSATATATLTPTATETIVVVETTTTP
ncbi:MAG: hypothetical protein CVU42_07170 [Chloroflexi bacterium HGW-Chloroflexi-4]|jgi:hypothetical protein|nr:MAG: hypothetical protein CVU45_06530 [Chloroflexi bacterium HGW-Chloroflexi-7]PKN99761.1 MAG: hypothetical protein CVU42_07170 [Chloroflexi bacterium HGW-Chloroflexi-4]